MKEEIKEKLRLARERLKPELLFTCKDYTIEKIHLNYRIIIKCAKRNQNQGIERDWYSSDEFGIDEAHDVANEAIAEFFKKGVSPSQPVSLRKAI